MSESRTESSDAEHLAGRPAGGLVAPERERRWAELDLVAGGTTARPGRDLFRSLTEHLARVLEARVAFVCERVHDDACARTLAVWVDGAFRESFEYDLSGTPCAMVYESSIYVQPEALRRRFPEDEWLDEIGAESYAGILLHDSAGEVIGHIGVVHDGPLGERRLVEAHLRIFAARAAAELERRKAEEHRTAIERALAEAQRFECLGTLAGGVAHDINNLLAGITGNIALAVAETGEGDALRRRLAEVRAAAERAADLARQMLAYSGREPAAVRPWDLTSLVAEMRDLLQASLPRPTTIVDDLEPGLPPVPCDATQIRQVVMNLVLNAAEAGGGAPGTIRLRTGRTEVKRADLAAARVGRDREPGPHVFVEVSDDGPGIEETMLGRIFEPGYTTKSKGGGLGLATVRGIVRAHEGALVVRSAPGHGTTFRILLPVGAEPAAAPAAPREALPSTCGGAGRVLLVDDSSSIRDVTRQLLEHLGCDVLVAAGATEGIDLFREHAAAIDCVLLDLTMPGLDGGEVLRAIRYIRPDAHVVLMSGYTEAEAARRVAGLAPSGFLQKPFGLEELGAVVRGRLRA